MTDHKTDHMTDPMSEDAQILRARKARYSLTHAIGSVITRRVALDLIDAFAPDPKMHVIEDVREELSRARARVIALEAENRELRAGTRQIRGLGADDLPAA